MAHGVLYADPTNKPLSPLTALAQLLPSSYYVFYLTGSTIPATIYQNGDLTVAYPSNKVTADSAGTFAGIFLDPTRVYRVQLFDQYNRRLMDIDPYVSSLTTFGTSQLAFNVVTGNVSITPTAPGGSGAALTVIARQSGIALDTGAGGFSPGVAELQLLNTGITSGTTTATFTASNKPGVANGAVSGWMPINVNGATFYIPLWL